MGQVVLGLLSVVILVAFVGCSYVETPPIEPPPSGLIAPQPETQPNMLIGLTVAPGSGFYPVGENITFFITLTNTKRTPIVFTPNPPVITIQSVNRGIGPIGSATRIVKQTTSGTGNVILQPGQNVTYTVIWDQRDSEGHQVPPYDYFLGVELKDIFVDGEHIPTLYAPGFVVLIGTATEAGL
jgi:hypothetical protein